MSWSVSDKHIEEEKSRKTIFEVILQKVESFFPNSILLSNSLGSKFKWSPNISLNNHSDYSSLPIIADKRKWLHDAQMN